MTKKNVFDGERCTKAFMKTYGHSWARVLSQQGFKDAQDFLLGWRAHHDGLMPVHLHVNHHFYFPAQFVGGFDLSDLLDKPWSQVSSLLPPGRAFVFIAHRVQHSHHYILRIHQALQSTPYIVHKDTIAINQTPHCNLTHRHPSKDSSTAGIISLYVRRSNIVVYSEHWLEAVDPT